MEIKTALISGAGNTFHVAWQQTPYDVAAQKKISSTICAQHTADGFIFLDWQNQAERKFKWSFFNNDGSDAEMCGNATRCVGFFVKNILNLADTDLKLQTVAGEIKIHVLNNSTFQIQMTPVIRKTHTQYFSCDTGVPHIVIESEQFANYRKRRDFCRELRFHTDFAPQGTNVTLVELLHETNQLRAVSYERGVEDFTAACGTGAMAAAFYNLEKRKSTKTQVEMPGGTLMMDLSDLQKPLMTGPAVLLGEYQNELTV